MSTSNTPAPPTNRHSLTAVEKQRSHLEKLLKDPLKPAFIPAPPKEKTIRPAREMMKNVQGSSAGAGSGEFHVYKASRRREYERLKLLEDEATKETDEAEFEKRRREVEETMNAKTSKNRAKRQKKKELKKKGGKEGTEATTAASGAAAGDLPIKKRRLVNGRELVFRKPDEGGDEEEVSEEEDEEERKDPPPNSGAAAVSAPVNEKQAPPAILEPSRLLIVEDD